MMPQAKSPLVYQNVLFASKDLSDLQRRSRHQGKHMSAS